MFSNFIVRPKDLFAQTSSSFMLEEGLGWKSLSANKRYLPLTGGATKHVLFIPFELFEILMEVNHEQSQGILKITIGAAGKTESYATLNIVTKTIGGIVGKKTKEQVSQSMQISGQY